jgi:signal transduction histidine kinase
MDEKEIILLVTVCSITFIITSAGIIFLIYYFFNTKQKFILEKQTRELNYEKEISKTKLEMQDQTLTYIGRELHDNIGQLLTVTKIHANTLLKTLADNTKLQALDNTIDKTIVELKALSKSLDNTRVAHFGIKKELGQEVERLNKTQICTIELEITGSEENLIIDKAIIIYRICQEFLSNSIKYSKTKTIQINISIQNHQTAVAIQDYGIGFDMQNTKLGSGILNIKNRIKLLQPLAMQFNSNIGEGTFLNFTINNK